MTPDPFRTSGPAIAPSNPRPRLARRQSRLAGNLVTTEDPARWWIVLACALVVDGGLYGLYRTGVPITWRELAWVSGGLLFVGIVLLVLDKREWPPSSARRTETVALAVMAPPLVAFLAAVIVVISELDPRPYRARNYDGDADPGPPYDPMPRP